MEYLCLLRQAFAVEIVRELEGEITFVKMDMPVETGF